MLTIKLFTFIFTVQQTVAAVDTVPACAVRCWDNTRYISRCLGDLACECGETKYQKTVYQCLYSQCDKSNFGSALRYTISQCPGFGNEELFATPLTPNREELRRREAEVAGGIAVAGGSGNPAVLPTGSAEGYPTQSANNYPTESAGSSIQTADITSTTPASSIAAASSTAEASITAPASSTTPANTTALPTLSPSQAPAATTAQPVAATSQPTSNVSAINSSPSNTALPIYTGRGTSISLSLTFIATTVVVVGSLLI